MTSEVHKKMFELVASGKVKTKGRYEVMPFDKIGWHKNLSAMVIPAACLAELLGLDAVESFIRSHKDPFDFCLRTKVPRSSKLLLVYEDGEEVQQQNICRYYPSRKGGKLVKLMPPLEGSEEWRRLGIDTEYTVETCNNMDDFDWNKLDYNYYIQEAKKLIDGVNSVVP